MNPLLRGAVVMLGAAVAIALPSVASAHEERPSVFPDGTGAVPAYRAYPAANRLVVCRPDSKDRIAKYTGALRTRNAALLAECRYSSIQDAVNAVRVPKSTIYVLPGVYTEDKYANSTPTGYCANLRTSSENPLTATKYIGSIAQPEDSGGQPIAISYPDQVRCPHNLNMIAILGDRTPTDGSIRCDSVRCGLQIEGTGASPAEVLIDNKFRKLNAVRADRAGGVYFRNFTVQQAEFNALYVMETDGFVVDTLVARATDEYGVLAFASDHGLIKNVDAYYNGDSGIYPGSASDVNANNPGFTPTRYSIEIRDNRMHHNALGYSGTAGNSVHAHHNQIWSNATGIATDSLFPDHPGMPQDHARFAHNNIWDNNVNYFERYVHTGVCDKPMRDRGYLNGVVCPVVPLPVGTGVLIAGGNANSVDHNRIWDNWRNGAMQFWVPAPARNEYDPAKLYDTSNHNHYVGNTMGIAPGGAAKPNGLDFWWDDEGKGNCWEGNTSAYPGGPRHNFVQRPASCELGGSLFTPGAVVKDAGFLSCLQYNRDDPVWRDPPQCDWMDTPDRPSLAQPALLPVADRAPAVDNVMLMEVGGALMLAVALVTGWRRRRARVGR